MAIKPIPDLENSRDDYERARRFALNLMNGFHVSVPRWLQSHVANLASSTAKKKMTMTPSEWCKTMRAELKKAEEK